MFDMTVDPEETRNLLYEDGKSAKEEALKAKDQLRQTLIQYEEQYGLEGCIENGDFVVLEEPADFFYRENNPPMFPKKQNTSYISLEEEVKRAVEKETVVRLEELDVAYFTERHTLNKELL